MDLHKINFWKRLEMFVENVQVNDAMSEEEKEMIIRIAQDEQKLNKHNVSGGLPDYQTLINFLESTKLKHHISDDCWYSCPMSDEGCCNHEERGCNCGAEAHNKKIDDFIKQHSCV